MNRSNFPWPAALALAVAALALTCAVARAERPTTPGVATSDEAQDLQHAEITT